MALVVNHSLLKAQEEDQDNDWEEGQMVPSKYPFLCQYI